MYIEEVDAIYYNNEIILKEKLRGLNIIPINSHFAYDEIKPFRDGLAAVRRDDKWGYVNKQGEEIIPCIYDNADDFSEGLAGVRVHKSGRWGFIDTKGNLVFKDRFIDVQPFSEGYAAVMSELEYKWGFMDNEGYLITPFEYDEATEFEDGMAVVQKDHQLMLINTKNERLSQQTEIDYLITHKKYIITGDNKVISSKKVISNDMYRHYFINTVDTEGTQMDDVDHEHKVVKKLGKLGYVDQYKEAITPIMYDSVTNFIDGIACVSINNKWSLIDENGHYITSGLYKYDPRTSITHNYRYAMVDKSQVKIIEAKNLFGLKIGNGDDTKIIWYNSHLEREDAKNNIYNLENGYKAKTMTLNIKKN